MAKKPEDITASSQSKYGYYFQSGNGNVLSHNENNIFETASTIKLLIMAYAFHEAERDQLKLRKSVKVHREDVGEYGSGLLQLFYLYEPLEIYNLIVLMMTVSDNVATNVLIRLLGKDNINKYAVSIGLKNTRLDMESISFTKNFEIGRQYFATSTPMEMTLLVDRIVNAKLHKKYYAEKAKTFMRSVQSSRVARRLPFTVDGSGIQDFGSKTGTLMWKNSYVFSEAGFFVDSNRKLQIFSLFGTGKLPKELPYSADSPCAREFIELAEALYYAAENH